MFGVFVLCVNFIKYVELEKYYSMINGNCILCISIPAVPLNILIYMYVCCMCIYQPLTEFAANSRGFENVQNSKYLVWIEPPFSKCFVLISN